MTGEVAAVGASGEVVTAAAATTTDQPAVAVAEAVAPDTVATDVEVARDIVPPTVRDIPEGSRSRFADSSDEEGSEFPEGLLEDSLVAEEKEKHYLEYGRRLMAWIRVSF